jgi:hypothetical protein
MFSSFSFKKPIRFRYPVVFLTNVVTIALYLSGCQLEDNPDITDTGFIPVGVWSSSYGDSYHIERGTLSHKSTWEESVYEGTTHPAGSSTTTGSLEAAVDFSANSGVIIIKISEDDSNYYTVGKYSAVYYSEYSATQLKVADAYIGFSPAETATLNEALNTFTAGNVGTHVSQWGTYTK